MSHHVGENKITKNSRVIEGFRLSRLSVRVCRVDECLNSCIYLVSQVGFKDKILLKLLHLIRFRLFFSELNILWKFKK